MNIEALRNRYPFPASRPDVAGTLRLDGRPEGWCSGDNVRMFEEIVPADAGVIIDGGSWMGLSAWHFLRIAPRATVICVDTWRGSEEHRRSCPDVLPGLYDTFIANMWGHRNRIIPLRARSLEGMNMVAEYGISPDVVYVDWAHDRASVKADISAAVKLFPKAVICGDDYKWKGVLDATDELRQERGFRFVGRERCWSMARLSVAPSEMDIWDEVVRKWTYRHCFGVEKYLHWWTQMERCDALIVSCGLADCAPKRILDISAGAGLFAYRLRHYGHELTLTNPPGAESKMYRDAIAALGFDPAIVHEYERGAFKPLPFDIGEYDVIVSRALTVMSFWGADEMESFIADCLEHITEGGCLLLSPNTFSDPDLMSKLNFDIERRKVNSCAYHKIHKRGA